MFITFVVFFLMAILKKFFLHNIEPSLIFFILIISSFFSIIIDFSKKGIHRKILILIIIGFLLRVLVMFIDIYGADYMTLPHSGKDSVMYFNNAIAGLSSGYFGRGGFYSRVVSVIIDYYGPSRVFPQFFNIIISINIIYYTKKIFEIYNLKYKFQYQAIFFLSLMPNFIILNSILLRESLISLLLLLSFYFFVKYTHYNNVMDLLFVLIFGLFASAFHAGSLFILVGISTVIIFYDYKNNISKINSESIIMGIFIAALFLFLYYNYFELFFKKFTNVSSVDDIVNVTVLGGSAYYIGINSSNSIVDFFINTPIRVFYFLLSPVPWDWRNIIDILTFIFNSLFYGITIFKSIKLISQRKKISSILVSLLVILFIGSIIFSWGTSNAGTALRHRDKMLPLFVMVYAFVNHYIEYGLKSFQKYQI